MLSRVSAALAVTALAASGILLAVIPAAAVTCPPGQTPQVKTVRGNRVEACATEVRKARREEPEDDRGRLPASMGSCPNR
jgi:hypothetical protein